MFKQIKYFIQRGKRGYSDRDLWDFSHYLAEMIPKALRQLKKYQVGYPVMLTEKEWDIILEKIITGFEAIIAMDDLTIKNYWEKYPKLKKTSDEGLELFIKYFGDLWD
jgi:hypothetical protein